MAVAAGAWFAPACPAASPEPTEAAGAPVPATPVPPAPSEFAFTFSPGYGTIDHWPTDPAAFEEVVRKLASAGFNTIHCVYRDWRVPICRRHGVKMMIDVLAWHDDARTDIRRPEQQAAVKTICRKVRGEPAVWGYNLWNEKLAFFGRPFGSDVNDCLAMLRRWDPTHPVWVGTYRNSYPQAVKGNPGVFGYYDYHWQRGMIWHFALLKWYQGLLNERDAWLGRWILVHDYNRNLYTLNTSLAHGLKVVIWFIGGPWNARTGDWNPEHHLVRVGRQVHHLYAELMRIGRPTAVYSTPTTTTPDDKDKEPGVPPHCTPFPQDCWVQVTGGEAVVGLFTYPGGADALFVANHNAFAPQRMVLQFKTEAKLAVNLFDRRTGAWRPLTVSDNVVTFDLAPGGGELLQVSGRARAAVRSSARVPRPVLSGRAFFGAATSGLPHTSRGGSPDPPRPGPPRHATAGDST